MTTTTITRPTCADCYFWISISTTNTVGECRFNAPTTLATAPQTKAGYWCGQFALPPAGSVVTEP
jgi:hypothetical protein